MPELSFLNMLRAIIITLGLLFIIGGVLLHPWIVLVVVCTLIALRLIVAWRRQLSLRMVMLGLGAGLVAGLAASIRSSPPPELGLRLFWTLFNSATVPILFVGGALLLNHTRLARLRLLEGQYAAGAVGFLWACVLALPPALLNILGGANTSDAWVDRWWEPLYAFLPAIAEETAARLFLTTFCYALLRPATNDRPNRAVIASVLIGALAHSLAHVPSVSILSAIIAGLLYGVPMALLFIKRDMEHAVGYHFFVDFVRFLAALSQ